jgi:hypothetical protein
LRPPAGFVYLLGRAATPGAAETRQFLSRNGVAFRWVDVDDDPPPRALSADRGGVATQLVDRLVSSSKAGLNHADLAVAVEDPLRVRCRADVE